MNVKIVLCWILSGGFLRLCFCYDLSVVTLVPLTGTEMVKGMAQKEAIQIAVQDVLSRRGLSNESVAHGVNFSFIDSQVRKTLMLFSFIVL